MYVYANPSYFVKFTQLYDLLIRGIKQKIMNSDSGAILEMLTFM